MHPAVTGMSSYVLASDSTPLGLAPSRRRLFTHGSCTTLFEWYRTSLTTWFVSNESIPVTQTTRDMILQTSIAFQEDLPHERRHWSKSAPNHTCAGHLVEDQAH